MAQLLGANSAGTLLPSNERRLPHAKTYLCNSKSVTNPFLKLPYEPALESLGGEFYDPVTAASFPRHDLRFRNDALLPILGLEARRVKDEDFIECFGLFEGVGPFLALRYHGYQFGEYNPYLGDGRGFLYGQVRGVDGQLYDLGTKGSGRTPYSRSADGRLTLKGGVREVLAAEALHRLGVRTSRCLSLIETGEALWRGDEPSPTRSAVMVRLSRSHIRFGTFERLYYLKRFDLISQLLDHVIAVYYPELETSADKYLRFYQVLVERVARLVAQWMVAGFCHGVLNTDNMSITGESFDYGPYGFIETYNPGFIAAYFDYGGRYSYGNQPFIGRLNLELLQIPLGTVVPAWALREALAPYEQVYNHHYQTLLLKRLGLPQLAGSGQGEILVTQTVNCLAQSQIPYAQFFRYLTEDFQVGWRDHAALILENRHLGPHRWSHWQSLYQEALASLEPEELAKVPEGLAQHNPAIALLRPLIESVWEAIDQEDNWQPFQELVINLSH